ncbi:hypothetical protein CK203_031051 [Vitis vinifera]|uniref:Uncharacterized protein n=1 Tax=Vitis vinifera TaxID=29760 RepID=A0A438I1A9_VITVI|nr:hypothetical protein CK203_031051 [Vitis vinifera]
MSQLHKSKGYYKLRRRVQGWWGWECLRNNTILPDDALANDKKILKLYTWKVQFFKALFHFIYWDPLPSIEEFFYFERLSICSTDWYSPGRFRQLCESNLREDDALRSKIYNRFDLGRKDEVLHSLAWLIAINTATTAYLQPYVHPHREVTNHADYLRIRDNASGANGEDDAPSNNQNCLVPKDLLISDDTIPETVQTEPVVVAATVASGAGNQHNGNPDQLERKFSYSSFKKHSGS